MKLPENWLEKLIFWEIHNFYDAVRPFQYVSWFFGFGFISHPPSSKPNQSNLVRLLNNYIFQLLWLVFYAAITYINLTEYHFEKMSSSAIANRCRWFVVTYGLMMVEAGVIISNYMRTHFMNAFRKFDEFDQEMAVLGDEVNLKLNSFQINAFCGFSYICLGVTIWVSAEAVDICESWILCVYMHVPFYIMAIVYVLFVDHLIIVLLSVVFRYKLLVEKLWEFTQIKPFLLIDYQSKLKAEYQSTTILRLAKLYETLTDCVDEMCVCFTHTQVFAMAAIFNFVVTTFFVVLQTYIYENKELGDVVVSFILWSIFYMAFTIITVVYGHALKTGANNIARIVHLVFNEYVCPDGQVRKDLRVFSLQLMHHVPAFSCGLFAIDWSLIYSMVSAITTYLMILIQFDANINFDRN